MSDTQERPQWKGILIAILFIVLMVLPIVYALVKEKGATQQTKGNTESARIAQ